jgi:hypothetical protein
MTKHPNLGSSLDDLLDEDGVRPQVEAAAVKRVLALQIEDQMRRRKITKSALAVRMHTSRIAVDRLLDVTNGSVTLSTLGKAAAALGCRLRVELV